MLLPSIPTIPSSGPAATDPLRDSLVAWWDLDAQTGSFTDRVNGLVAAPLPTGGCPFRIAGAEGWAPDLTRTRGQALVVADNVLHRLPTDLAGFSFTYAIRAKIKTFLVSSGVLARANVAASVPELALTTQVADRLQARLQTLATPITLTTPSNELISLDSYFTARIWVDNGAATFNLQLGTGVKQSSTLVGKTFTPTNPTLQFGRYSNFWDGAIDWVGYWTRVLTDAEWARLLSGGDSGRPLTYPFNSLRSLRIVTPSAYQVCQRNAWGAGLGTADISVAGTYRGAASGAVQARWNGGAWQTLDAAPTSGRFSGTLAGCPVGQGLLEVRWENSPGVVASVANVGVGDVVFAWGQSNMSGRGLNNQPVTATNFIATLFGNDGAFKVLADPYDSKVGALWSITDDTSATGSYIPAMVSAWMLDQQCPVMVIPGAIGGTTVAQWQPNADRYLPSTFYGAGNARCLQAGPVGFGVCHLWESDAMVPTAEVAFKDGFRSAADAYFTDRGFKTWVAIPQQCSSIDDGVEANYRTYINALIAENGNILLGADCSDQVTDDTLHLRTDAKLLLIGGRFFAAVKASKEA